MIAKVTAPDLAQDVAGAEALISRHQEYHAEIDSRVDAFTAFYATGRQLINQVTHIVHSLICKLVIILDLLVNIEYRGPIRYS